MEDWPGTIQAAFVSHVLPDNCPQDCWLLIASPSSGDCQTLFTCMVGVMQVMDACTDPLPVEADPAGLGRPLTEYELEREANIHRNRARLAELTKPALIS